MKDYAYNIAIVGILCMFLWIAVSWVDVLCHNEPDDITEPHPWNVFVLMTETFK